MKILLTKTLFISLLFSAIAPVAIKGNEAVSAGFFSGLKERATNLMSNAQSYVSNKASDTYSSVANSRMADSLQKSKYCLGEKIANVYSSVSNSRIANTLGSLPTQYPKIASYSAYVTGTAAVAAVACKAYNSERISKTTVFAIEKAKNGIQSAYDNTKKAATFVFKKAKNGVKKAWDNKYVRYGVPAALLATAGYAGAVRQGYALNPSEMKTISFLTWQCKNWKIPFKAWKIKMQRSPNIFFDTLQLQESFKKN
ncbi:MAG: hypothetical protein WCD44_01425 [Candidatus Babeliales bacterium]